MRIAYISTDPGIPIHGRKGASVHVTEVVRALRRDGHHVEVFSPRVQDEIPDDLVDLAVHQLDPVDGAPASRERALLAGNTALRQRLDSSGPWDLVYERYALMSHAAGAWATSSGVPFVVEVNAPLVDEQARHRRLVHRELAENVTRRLFGHATAIITVSDPVAHWTRARSSHPERVHVVPNGVDPARFVPSEHPDRPMRPVTIGFVGTLKPWHGVEVLLDATARIATATDVDCRLRIVGDGPQRAALAERAHRLGLERITTFTGSVAPDTIPDELARMDIGTVPQVPGAGDYFSPMKVFEYQAAGLPVVASTTGQLVEVVHHGATGLCCRPGDVDDLAAALHRLVFDAELRRRLGDAGRRWVTTHRTWDTVVARILAAAGMSAVTATNGSVSESSAMAVTTSVLSTTGRG